ncbi:DDE-type integrase/transposase/recombinase [Nitrosomonas sp. Nm33]|uniref:DDE-type integrase/transposase/recombinase n=1 Tax=Nitrosomonas sp. Nm33 TaxID=133724 RepID=UPI0008990ED3|nr:DDE-type integrase/transposase/recombinase [Nitrosomonas sp. Nm33]SDY29568.1 Integrase core domain-containing protein [Nitrosomonas sp. Nm33]
MKREAKRYNKSYPGELVHFDTKRLPLLKGQSPTQPREYLFVAVDDFSRELYAAILPDKTQKTVIAQCPCQIDYAYSDNGKEYKGTVTVMLSLRLAKRTASARNSLKSIDPKPTVKLNVLSTL